MSLDDDGYYWFLHPLFEDLATKTGQYIDLYDNATFEVGVALDELQLLLVSARYEIDVYPECWEVNCGTQTQPTRRELMKLVCRTEFYRLLDVWERVIARARETGWPVICFGD